MNGQPISISSATAELAFEGHHAMSVSHSSLWKKDHIQVSSAAFPDRSIFTARPLEMIIASQDRHDGHPGKFLLPIEAKPSGVFSMKEADSKTQNILPEQILQVRPKCKCIYFGFSIFT